MYSGLVGKTELSCKAERECRADSERAVLVLVARYVVLDRLADELYTVNELLIILACKLNGKLTELILKAKVAEVDLVIREINEGKKP